MGFTDFFYTDIFSSSLKNICLTSRWRWALPVFWGAFSVFTFFFMRPTISFIAWRHLNIMLRTSWMKYYHISIILDLFQKTRYKSSVISQKGESKNSCSKKVKHTKFSEKWTFLTSWYAHWDSPFCLITDDFNKSRQS